MGLLDKIRGLKLLLTFEIALGEENDVGVKILTQSIVDDLELVRFWALAEAKILYEIWVTNTPQAFLAMGFMTRVLERELDPATDCLERAELLHVRYVPQVQNPVEQIVGVYLGRDDGQRTIRFLTPPAFEGNIPRPLAMVSGVVLFQYVLDRVKTNARAFRALSETGRMLVTEFATEKWAGEASVEKLPQAAFARAIHFGAKG